MHFHFHSPRIASLALATLLSFTAASQGALISIVNLDGAGEGFNETTPATPVGGNPGTTLGEQRLKVFEEAAARWGGLLQSSVEIKVEAQFDPLGPGVLGAAGPINGFADFANAPVPATFFPVALANAIAGADLDPTRNDIRATFSTQFTFYMGFDGNPPPGQSDLLLVVMHEIGHGLGFLTFVNRTTGQKFQGMDDHYMRFLIDETNGKLWPDMTDAERATSSLNTGGLQWSGANAKTAAAGLTVGNGSLGPRMYAPPVLQGGSSVSHWDNVFVPDELMEPAETPDPQQFMTEALFKDIGWPFNTGGGGGGAITLRIDDPSVQEGNSGSVSLDFTISLSAPATQDVSVDYATAAGTATQGTDFVPASGTAAIAAGSVSTTVSVTVLGDSIQESDETILLNLSSISGATLADNQGRGTIIDDDAIQVAVADAQIVEGDSGSSALTFAVNLAGGVANQDVSVRYATADGSAIAGIDYGSTNGLLIFPPGLTNLNVTVPITGDTLPEPDETFFVNLTSVTNAVIADFQGVGTIVNDDDGSVLSISNADANELNSGTRDMIFTVTLQPSVASTVTVDYATSDGTATAGSDYNAAMGTLTFAPGVTQQSIAIGILGDLTIESNETFHVNLGNPSGAFVNIARGTGTIVEDDGGFVHDLVVTRDTNAFNLARAITSADNTGLKIKEIRLSGHGSSTNASSGLFEIIGDAPHTYGLTAPGVVISTGDVLDYESGLNEADDATTAFGALGFFGAPATVAQEALLDPITGGGTNNYAHYDATQLDIRFDAPANFDQVSFRVSFGSEEYPEYVASEFIDGFGIYLNGTNIAFTGGQPININHPDMTDLPGTELDGVISQGGFAVIQFNALVRPGSKDNTLTFILADTEDGRLDSTVYISSLEASSPFTAGDTPVITRINPPAAPINSVIEVDGFNFAEDPADNIVFLGPVRAQVKPDSTPNKLKVIVPAGASFGKITVTVDGLTAVSPAPFGISFESNEDLGSEAFAGAIGYPVNGKPEDLVVGDLDNDGRPDLIVVNREQNRLSIFRNETIPNSIGSGALAVGIDLPTGLEPSDVAAGDLNGDGFLDLVISCSGTDTLNVLQNTTSGGFISFSAAFAFDVGSAPRGIAIADLDRDGRQDIIVCESGRSFVSVLRNQRTSNDLGLSSFAPKVSYLVGSDPVSVAVGDLNGDQHPDLVVANSFNGPGGRSVSVLRNLGITDVIDSRSFASRVNHAIEGAPVDIQLADIDRDGLLDIVTSNQGQNTVSVLFNEFGSPGSFPTVESFGVGLSIGKLVVADLDGQGGPDIAVANRGLSRISLLKNTVGVAEKSFTAGAILAAPAEVLAVNIADIDLNGKPEIVSANADLSISVFRNTVRSSSVASWNPAVAEIVYGTKLSEDQLNGTATTAGDFVYNPPAGTVLPAGVNQVVATFVPRDTINFTLERITNDIVVLKAPLEIIAHDQTKVYKAPVPALTWEVSEERGFVNGEDESVLNTLPIFETYVNQDTGFGQYYFAITIKEGGEATADNYDITHMSGSFFVDPASPVIVWPNPPDLPYDSFLTTELHLNAAVSPALEGSFSYEHDEEPLSPGTHTLTATFTPADNINYVQATDTVTINVVAASMTLTWEPPADIVYGTALSETQLNALYAPDVPGTFEYSPAAGTILGAGAGQTLTATYTPIDTTRYSEASVSVTLNVLKADPDISWNSPEGITYGASLNETDHLNATFSVPGTAVYSPAAGAIPNAGEGQMLTVTFTPDDTDNYNVVSTSVPIDVAKADPVVAWESPEGIVYGTPLNTTDQLNATADIPGLFQFTPVAGEILNAGNAQALNVLFTPTDSANYNTASAEVSIDVAKADVTLTWDTPAGITYGTPLGEEQLNASVAETDGTFTYTPAAESVLSAGQHTLQVDFTPDSDNFNPASTTVTIEVAKANPQIVWNTPMDIPYGTTLSETQLNATEADNLAGTFVYTPDENDDPLPVGAGHELQVVFTPDDTANHTTAGASVFLNVVKADPVIVWNPGANGVYPFILSETQLNAVEQDGLEGAFAYTPAADTPLAPGTHTLSVSFTPVSENHNEVTANFEFTVDKATPSVMWESPEDVVYGTPLSPDQLNATATVPGSFAYDPPVDTILDAGNDQTLTVWFIPDDLQNYTTNGTAMVLINVLKADPPNLEWNAPDPIPLGVALSSTQLNATAGIPGQFVYSPPADTLLSVGDAQELSATFTPDDADNYNSAVVHSSIDVVPSALEIAWSTPDAIDYLTPLGPTQLNATAEVSGTFEYDPPEGTVLSAGANQVLSVLFTPDDTANHVPSQKQVLITVRRIEPIVTWDAPAPINYETPLGPDQLNAAANVPGAFAYSPPSGSLLGAGDGQTLHVAFTPTDALNYNPVFVERTLDVRKLAPSLTWTRPAGIAYGTALSVAQLNALADIDGSFTYDPPAETVLEAGQDQVLSATFTPEDPANYTSASIQTMIDVAPSEPTISWADPAPIVFGQALGSGELNATATAHGTEIPGTFTYDPAAGTMLDAGEGQILTVLFTPDDNNNNTTASAQVSIDVLKADPAVTWDAPAGIAHGTALDGTQLNATANIPGSFSYDPPAGTILNAGSAQQLSVTFTPDDADNFNNASSTVAINVAKATPTLSWSAPAPIVFGTPLGSSQLNAATGVPGTFAYFPPAGTVLSAGTGQRLDVLFTPANPENYTSASASVLLDVTKAASELTWKAPADIIEGAPLSSTQLNAIANVPGSFVYNPALGTILPVGDNQILQVTFTPDDQDNFDGASTQVALNVKSSNLPPEVSITSPRDGSTITPLSDLAIVVEATDGGSIAKVEFFEGSNKLGELTSSPFRLVWPDIPLGSYALTAVATDDTGLTTTSTPINIGVPPAPSSVQISPTTGQITVGLVGEDGVEYDVLVSSDLKVWTKIAMITGTGGEIPIIDPTIAAEIGQRFYRLVPTP